MNFSQRNGYEPIKLPIQDKHINDATKNRLWNIIYSLLDGGTGKYDDSFDKETLSIIESYWDSFFKLPVNCIPYHASEAIKQLQNYFYNLKWNKTYDFLEFTANIINNIKRGDFIGQCNTVFEEENTAYRFIENYIIKICSDIEIDAIKNSLSFENSYKDVSTHINTALKMLSDRENRNFRNSVKESISAIEALVKKITSSPNSTLGQALSNINLHSAFKVGLEKIYGYTCDADGIRHSLTDGNQPVEYEDALFMLIMCSAFTSYIISKNNSANI